MKKTKGCCCCCYAFPRRGLDSSFVLLPHLLVGGMALERDY